MGSIARDWGSIEGLAEMDLAFREVLSGPIFCGNKGATSRRQGASSRKLQGSQTIPTKQLPVEEFEPRKYRGVKE